MPKKDSVLLQRFHSESSLYEFALDEVGRGCLFGRVYVACVVLPKDPTLFTGIDGTNITPFYISNADFHDKKIQKGIKSIVGISPTMVLLFPLLFYTVLPIASNFVGNIEIFDTLLLGFCLPLNNDLLLWICNLHFYDLSL